MSRKVPCPACNGKGGKTDYWGEYDECSQCEDTMLVSKRKAVEIQARLDAEDAYWQAFGEREKAIEEAMCKIDPGCWGDLPRMDAARAKAEAQLSPNEVSEHGK
jgi:hypothetical protein